ncbi:TonB-dependent receptor [Fulvivirgaceae bacterium BMA12]|uniref:TonB-dependent receptor n=1 Tax=Agaribacillus aureus TaxID=3051825 RepID=A0ABT8L9T0_9BACT|nr:TonB-dependent receptor [Fulvivirgaceae bacterium BMA12]
MRGLLILLLFSTSLQAQVVVQLVGEDHQKAIQGAEVIFTNSTGQRLVTISDREGKARCGFRPPVFIQGSHIRFIPINDTVRISNTKIVMKVSTLALDEVVVTGQFAPQSAKNSVYKVRTIDRTQLQAQGANTLQDVLMNQLNIRFGRDNALGTSGIRIQGISGQNVKVLIDGVPMIGRSGVANEIDINQINVNTIERIEIVEGPMAVNFGADALAGVINIITRKGGTSKLSAELILQEETVEDNYSLFDEGVHNAGLTIGGKPSDRIFVQAEARINRFGGWIGDESRFTDRNRQWYPKTQHFGGGLVRYEKDDFSIHYRMDYLNESISNLGSINDVDADTEPFSSDQEFNSDRWMHQLQAELKAGSWLLNPVLSFTDYKRATEAFTTFLESDLEINRREIQNTYYKTLFFRNTASTNRFDWGSLQLGTDASFDRGGGSTLSDGEKEAVDIAFFASAEIKLGEKIALRPGIRYGYNSLYSSEPAPSLNVKYNISEATQVRFGYGRGFRVPSLRELYHEFIDANHNIIGNSELTPEYSHNINADVTQSFKKLTLSLSGFYNHINDQITFFTPQESNAATTYLNLEEFRSTGATINAAWSSAGWRINSGATYIGRYQRLNDEVASVPGFVFNWEANTNIRYRFSATNTTISAFYKFNGSLRDYRLTDPDGDGEFTPELQGIDSFHLMDLTISQAISNSLGITLGARNLFNVTAVDNNFSSGGAHSSSAGSTSVGYGTSYFFRLNYQFKSNN